MRWMNEVARDILNIIFEFVPLLTLLVLLLFALYAIGILLECARKGPGGN